MCAWTEVLTRARAGGCNRSARAPSRESVGRPVLTGRVHQVPGGRPAAHRLPEASVSAPHPCCRPRTSRIPGGAASAPSRPPFRQPRPPPSVPSKAKRLATTRENPRPDSSHPSHGPGAAPAELLRVVSRLHRAPWVATDLQPERRPPRLRPAGPERVDAVLRGQHGTREYRHGGDERCAVVRGSQPERPLLLAPNPVCVVRNRSRSVVFPACDERCTCREGSQPSVVSPLCRVLWVWTMAAEPRTPACAERGGSVSDYPTRKRRLSLAPSAVSSCRIRTRERFSPCAECCGT